MSELNTKSLKFKEDITSSFNSQSNKLTLFQENSEKIAVLSGAMAIFFNDLDKSKPFIFSELQSKFFEIYPDYDAKDVETVFKEIQEKLLENDIISET